MSPAVPHLDYAAPPTVTSAARARRFVHTVAWIALITPMYEYLCFFVNGLSRAAWRGELGGFFVVVSAGLGAAALAVGFLTLWFFAIPAFRLVSGLSHVVLGRKIDPGTWEAATLASPWTLPRAAADATALWFA